MGVTTTWSDLGAAWLLTYALHSTLLLGGAWLLTRLLGRSHRGRPQLLATQETVWRAALLGGLVTATLQLGLGWQPSLGTWRLDGWLVSATTAGEAPGTSIARASETAGDAARPESFRVAPERPARTDETPARGASAGASRPTVPAPTGLRVPGADPARPALTASPARPLAPWLPRWTLLVTGLWLLGALVLSGMLVLSYRSFCRRIRNRSRVVGGDVRRLFDDLKPNRVVGRSVALSASSRLQSPLAKGVTRPEICLPVRALSELSTRQQKTLLAHELGHLVRRDPAWLLVFRALESVFFIQPFNRVARRRLQEISELRADDWAVTATGEPLDLARCLTRVAGWNLAPVPVPSMAAEGSGLTRRVHRLLQTREVESERRPARLWLAVAAVLLLVAWVAPSVRAGVTAPEPAPEPAPAPLAEPPAAPEAPVASVAPEVPEAPETPVALPRAIGELPAPPAPVTAPTPGTPPALETPPVAPTPSIAPAPAPAPMEGLGLGRPPRIAPIPRVPVPAPPARPGEPGRLAWMAARALGEPGEAPEGERDWDTDDLSPEEKAQLAAELAETLDDALSPLADMQKEISAQIAEQLEQDLGSLDVGLDTLDETLEGELQALEELLDEDDLVVGLSDRELSELRKSIEAMNAKLLAGLEPDLDLDVDLEMPEVENLARQSAEQAHRLAEQAQRLAQDGLSKEEADRLREEARRLAEQIEPRREEMERLAAEAARMAREARERALDENRERREQFREQQRQQMDELRQKLEELRAQRSEDRERRREELRQRLEAQRERMESLRRELRTQQESRRDELRKEMQKRLEAQRQELELQRQQLRQQLERERQEQQREREEHRLQMEEHRRERESEPGNEVEEGPEEEPGEPPAAA